MYKRQIKRICILVKAYPQPSKKYQETVCCAGITEDGELIRLYPIAFRTLLPEQRFSRFDWIEGEVWRSESDFRPESYKVEPSSIRIVEAAAGNPSSRVKLWLPYVESSMAALRASNQDPKKKKSLGIIKPIPESVRFKVRELSSTDKETQEETRSLYLQNLLFQEDFQKLPDPTHAFEYHFRSGANQSKMTIHDWEVQAAFFQYKKLYGGEAIERLRHMYEEVIPQQNLHLIMGTQLSRPQQFMIIGVLRTTENLEALTNQASLF